MQLIDHESHYVKQLTSQFNLVTNFQTHGLPYYVRAQISGISSRDLHVHVHVHCMGPHACVLVCLDAISIYGAVILPAWYVHVYSHVSLHSIGV